MAWLLMFAAIAALATGTVAQDDEEEPQPGVNVRATWRFHRQAVQMQNWKKGMAASLNGLTAFVNTIATDILQMNADVEAAAGVLNQYADNINAVVDELHDTVANYSGPAEPEYVAPPAFQVFISGSEGTFSPIGTDPFRYHDVSINLGDHFDTDSGLFTAPVSGLYYLFATFTHSFDSEAVIMVATPAGGYSTVGYMKFYNGQETACTTVAMMSEGDTVGMYPFNAGSSLWQLNAGVGNTFGGYLIGRRSAADAPDPTTTTEAPTTTSPPETTTPPQDTTTPPDSTT